MAEVIGAAVLTAVGVEATVTVAGVSVASVIGSAIITASLVGLQYALAPKPDAAKPSDGSQPIRAPTMARLGGYGQTKVAGATVCYEAKDGNSCDVFAMITGKVGGYVGYYLHDDPVILGSGPDEKFVLDDGGLLAQRYVGSVAIATRLGLPTETCYPRVVGTLEPGIWTVDHRGDGIASMMMFCAGVPTDVFQTVYPNGLPQPSAVMNLYPVYDARDGMQDPDDPDTWQVSRNPILNIIDYLTHPDHGLGFDRDLAITPNIDALMAEADICDELVLRKDEEFEPRYALSGTYTFDANPDTVIGAMLAACDGWMAEVPGEGFVIKVGKYRAPTKTIEMRHIHDYSIQTDAAREEKVNELTFTYNSPPHKYKDIQGDPWRDEDSISALGRVLSKALDLTWVQSHAQARRIAKPALARLNAPLRGKIETRLCGVYFVGERWVRLKLTDFPRLADVVVEITRGQVSVSSGRVTFEFVVIDPATINAWDPDTEEGSEPPLATAQALEPIPVPQHVNAAVEGDVVNGFHLLVSFDDPSRPDLTYRVRYRVTSPSGPWVDQASSTAVAAAGRLTTSTAPVPGDSEIEVQAAFVATSGARGDWSGSVIVGSFSPGLEFNLVVDSQYIPLLEDV